MSIIRQATRSFAFIMLCAALAHGQVAAPVAEKEFATLYVYRLDYDYMVPFFNKTLPVYFTEGAGEKQRKIAGLRRKRYFMLRLPPGDYFLDTHLMRGKLKLDVEAGGEYYLRLDQGSECPSSCDGSSDCSDRNPSIVLMPLEGGRKELLKMKPLKPQNVQDRKLVIIPSAVPDQTSR